MRLQDAGRKRAAMIGRDVIISGRFYDSLLLEEKCAEKFYLAAGSVVCRELCD